MVHTIYGDAEALLRYACADIAGVFPFPTTFECEECQNVREAIFAWQQAAEGKCERGECECGFHAYVVGFPWPRSEAHPGGTQEQERA